MNFVKIKKDGSKGIIHSTHGPSLFGSGFVQCEDLVPVCEPILAAPTSDPIINLLLQDRFLVKSQLDCGSNGDIYVADDLKT